MTPMLARRASRATCAIMGFAALAAPAAGRDPQQIKLAASEVFSERYLQRPTVSGSLLVGVRWRGRDGRFDPGLVGLQVSPAVAGGTACVEIASEDGRYSAENLYWIDGSLRGEALFEARTNYPDDLARYPLANISVMVRKTASCDAVEGGQIVPAVLAPGPGAATPPPGGDGRELMVDVNADADKVALRLSVPGRPDAVARCEPAGEGARISFSTRCVIAVPQAVPAGTYDLVLDVRERFKRVSKPFALLLDGPP